MTPAPGDAGPASLTVLYDAECALCRRCREWMETQRTFVPVRFLAASSTPARDRRSDLPWLGADLVVVGDRGEVWAGAAAFLTCHWSTVGYREWSYRLSGPSFSPLAERFFHMVSSNRTRIGAVVGSRDCPDGVCKHRHGPTLVQLPPPPAPMPPPAQLRPPVHMPPPAPAQMQPHFQQGRPPPFQPRPRQPWEPPPPPPRRGLR